jgi:hypothetical protein
MSILFRRVLRLYGKNKVTVEKSACELPRLYRRFDLLEHAQDFVAGHIYVSTLEKCRNSEDHVRRDEGEGRTQVETGLIYPGVPNYENLLRRFGFDPAMYKNAVIANSRERRGVRDAWLLCMSTDRGGEACERLGDYVVEISRPREFFAELSLQLHAQGLCDECSFGPVVYGPRTRKGLEPPLAPDAFVKPLSFALELEVRFVWEHSESVVMQPQLIKFSGLSGYLKLV